MGTGREPPEDVKGSSLEALERETKARDRRLTRLFRRWPTLTQAELGELRRLYEERMRLAKLDGSRRRRPHL
jgi:hypothetical protein